MKVDFGETARDYARHRRGLPDELFTRLAAQGIGSAGQHVVDVGAGTGAMALALARRGCRVIAVDRSAGMLAQLAAQADGLDVRTVVATAEVTGLASGAADVVTAASCWHWFDGPLAAAEARRLLVPGGRLVITNLDWCASPVVDATLAVLDAAHGGPTPWASNGLATYAPWPALLEEAGFVEVSASSFLCEHDYDRASWRGRMRASSGFLALSEEARARVNDTLAALLDQGPERFAVPHQCFTLVATRPIA